MTRRWFCVLAAAVSLWGTGRGDDEGAKKLAGEATMDTSGVNRVIEQAHVALEKIVNGNSEEYKRLFSERDLPSPLAFDHARILADYFRFKRTGERPL